MSSPGQAEADVLCMQCRDSRFDNARHCMTLDEHESENLRTFEGMQCGPYRAPVRQVNENFGDLRL